MQSVPRIHAKTTKEWIYTLSGEDYQIINSPNCDDVAKKKFYQIGVYVFGILLVSVLGSSWFFYHSFGLGHDFSLLGLLATIIGSLVWGIVVTNLYILLLYSISPEILPVDKPKNIELGKMVSFAVRIGFMAFLAIIISQLIICAFFNMFSDSMLHRITTDNELIKKLEKFEESDQIVNIINCINSNFPFYIFSILASIGGIYLFVRPIIEKYQLRKTSNFYQLKKEIEERIIRSEYKNFKTKYANLFAEQFPSSLNKAYGHELYPVQFFEAFQDPPFNTKRKEENEVQTLDGNLLPSFIYEEDEDWLTTNVTHKRLD